MLFCTGRQAESDGKKNYCLMLVFLRQKFADLRLPPVCSQMAEQ